jgi:hypothetical protein
MRRVVLSGVAFAVIGLAADAGSRRATSTYADRERRHWSFVASHPAVPSFTTPAEKAGSFRWIFILQRLKQED